jgi:hypothetical protein
MKILAPLLLLCLQSLPVPAARDHGPAQDPAQKAPPPFVVQPGEEPLEALIERCAAYLQRNILFAPEEMATKAGPPMVRLQQPLTTDRQGCEDFLSQMLYRAGFVLTYVDEQGSLLEVLSMNGQRGREILQRAVLRSADDVVRRPNLRVPVSVVLELQHTNAAIATNALRPFFASNGNGQPGQLTLGNFGNSAAIVIAGMQDQVAHAVRLVRSGDVKGGKEYEDMYARFAAIEARLDAVEGKKR